jgi:hypothetical protein
MAAERPRTRERAPDGVVTRSTKAMSAAGVIAAVAIALLANVLAARHYKRVDFTSSRLYTLSPATLETLRSLSQTVRVEVLLAPSDPLAGSVASLLDAYGAETTRLEVHRVDPDRHPAEFVAVQQRYGVVAGRTEDGRVLTDASVIVSSSGKHWFVTSSEMVDLSEAAEGRSRSKIEQALTGAIRAVLGGERARVCASTGHGEFGLDDAGPQGLSELKDRLAKNNYDAVTVDATKPDAREPFKDCRLLVAAGPGQPFSPKEADEIAKRVRDGMSALLLVNPMLDPDKKAQLPTGLEPVTRMFGIGLSTDFVFELDEHKRLPKGVGEAFFPELKPHAITEGLIAAAAAGYRVMVMRTRSLSALPGEVQPATILATSAEAYGMADFFGWVERGGEPRKRDGDRAGPLAIGMASELSKPAGSAAAHGPRVVVLGSASVAFNQNWQEPLLRGNSILVENAISWLAARPPILDVPAKQTPAATLHLSEGSLGEILRYVLLFMPAAPALLGLAVYLRRRSVERRPADAKAGDAKPGGGKKKDA